MDRVTSRAGESESEKVESEESEAFFNVPTAGFSALALALESGLHARLVFPPFMSCILALTGNSGREVKLNIFHEAALIEYNSRKASEPTQRNAHFQVNLRYGGHIAWLISQGDRGLTLQRPLYTEVPRHEPRKRQIGGVYIFFYP